MGNKSQITLSIVDARWSAQALARAYDRLPTEERQRVDRMCDSGKQQLIVSLAVRRPLLAKVTGISATELRLARDDRGKQILVNDPSWHFSVADTTGCVVLAIAQHQSVGVDVEHVDRRIHNLADFMRASLSVQEQQLVQALSFDQQRDWVLRAWVLKEAYTKRLGVGLSYGFQRLTVDPDDPGSDLFIWSDYLQHYVALSVEQAGTEPVVELLTEASF